MSGPRDQEELPGYDFHAENERERKRLMAEHKEGMSIGAQRVRESFNPSENNLVDKIKRYTADLIDLCEDLKNSAPEPVVKEQARLACLAQTAYEEAAMWAVKAATTNK